MTAMAKSQVQAGRVPARPARCLRAGRTIGGAEGPGDQRDAGVQRRPVQALLQQQVNDQDERAEGAVEPGHDHQADDKAALAEQRRGDDRVLAVPFGDDEQREQDDRGTHHDVGPGGPAEFASLDQRDDEQGRGRR